MSKIIICKSCNQPNDDKMESRRICKPCFKKKRHEYYENNKDKYHSKYVKTNKPRGRPPKKEDDNEKE